MQNMTDGNVSKRMVSFAMPILLGNILQQLYNTADAVILGKFAGKSALATVGTASPIMNILIFLMVGITMGASVLLAEFFGARQYKKVKEEEITSILSGIIFTLIVSVIGILLTRPLLLMINTPDEILPQSETYLHIIITGLIFSFLYNMLSSSLRSIGDSVAPLIFLVLSLLVNVFLCIFTVKYMGLGVKGSAYSTVIAQAVSAILCIIYIFLKVPIFKFNIQDLRINSKLLAQTVHYSLVSAVQQTFLYVGIFILQGAINPLGVDTIAAYNAVTKIDGFALAPTDSLAISLTTFTSQNRGAKKMKRIRQGMKSSLIMGIIYCTMLAVFVFFTAGILMTFFLSSDETHAILIGFNYLRIMAVFYLLPAFCNSFQGLFRGLGRMDITLWATIIQIPVRVALSYMLVDHLGMNAVAVSIAIGWVCMICYEYLNYLHYDWSV